MTQPQIRICFVCLGNICRSPTAEGVMKKLVDDAGLAHRVFVDSAGTAAYHTGERADVRSRAEALRRGVELTSLARQFVVTDFEGFDYVIAMDRQNERDIKRLASEPEHRAKVTLLRRFEAQSLAPHSLEPDVPDPYYGGERGFADVYDICLAACRELLEHVRREHKL